MPGILADEWLSRAPQPVAPLVVAPAMNERRVMTPRRVAPGFCAGRQKPAFRPDGRQAPRVAGRAQPRLPGQLAGGFALRRETAAPPMSRPDPSPAPTAPGAAHVRSRQRGDPSPRVGPDSPRSAVHSPQTRV